MGRYHGFRSKECELAFNKLPVKHEGWETRSSFSLVPEIGSLGPRYSLNPLRWLLALCYHQPAMTLVLYR